MDWIPVSESLPPAKQVVLAYTSWGHTQLCVRHRVGDIVMRPHPDTDKIIWYPSNFNGGEIPVTHWMPLPEPPEKPPPDHWESTAFTRRLAQQPLTAEMEEQVSKIFKDWKPG